MQTEYLVPVLTFASGIGSTIFISAIKHYKRKSKLDLDESSIKLSISPNNEKAATLFNNCGNALFLTVDIECKGETCLLQRSTITLKNSGCKKRIVGTLFPQNRPVPFRKGDFKTICFVFDPGKIAADFQSVIDTFHCSATSFSLYANKSKPIGETKMKKRIRDIEILDTKTQYILEIPPTDSKDRIENVQNLLSANGFDRGTVVEKKVERKIVSIDSGKYIRKV